MKNLNSQIVIYKDQNGKIKIDVRFDGNTVWLTQNIFQEGELDSTSVCREFRRTGTDGKEYLVKYYNLDLILAVGYRVKSTQGTAFRKWATERLSDYIEELERTIADIRTSEKRFYRKITDIYATSVDYDPTNDQSILFFKTVQNKVHYAVTGNTAAEIVIDRIDSDKKNLGLTTFRGAKPTREEVVIAKNYYNAEELTQLNALVEQYLIFATEQARRRVPMTMNDWIEKLHGFLTINDRNILQDAGRISHELMVEIAEKKFDKYKQIA